MNETSTPQNPNPTKPAPDSSHAVGYCTPPKETRFQPGTSGNPAGRPRRRRSVLADLAARLDAQDPHGTGTIQQRLVQNLVDEAAAGKVFALKALLPLALALDHGEAGADDPAATDLEQKLIGDFTSRLQSADPVSSVEGSDA